MENMEFIIVYITAKDRNEAKKIGAALVKERLAACVNIINGMSSIYRWQGKIEKANEVVVIAKSRKSLIRKVIKRVTEMHSYTCPCVVAFPIIDGNKDFLKWIGENTK